MGYIYIDSTSDVRVGRIDESGNVYNWGYGRQISERMVGRIDENGKVYAWPDMNRISERIVGRVDERGYIYRGINSLDSAETYVGRVHTDGKVYECTGKSILSETFAGKVDTDNKMYSAGAAFLILIKPTLQGGNNKEISNPGETGENPDNTDLAEKISKLIKKFFSALKELLVGLAIYAFPFGMLFLGAYLPYDIVFGNDAWGFAEYSPLFLIVYGLSAVMIILSLITQIKTGEAQLAVIYIYGFSALILMAGAFREGHPFMAILSIFPALILFAFPAIIWGLITFIINLFVKMAEKKGRGPSSSEKVDKVLGVIFNVVGIILLVVSGIIGFMIAEV